MFQRLWNALKACIGAQRDEPAAPHSPELSPEPADAAAPKNKSPNRPGHITTAQRLAMLQSAAHQKNYGPPVPKVRDFDRMRGAQFRMKRYTRAK